jgi:hypothetical protein
MDMSVIKRMVEINGTLFVINRAFLAFGIGRLRYGKPFSSDESGTAVVMVVGTFLIALAMFIIIRQPIDALSDTILVYFVEAPDCTAEKE